MQQSPKQTRSGAQLEHSAPSAIPATLAPSSAIAFAVEGAIREGIVTKLITPSALHLEYH